MKNQEKQKELDLKDAAILIIDPQNDFLSEGGAIWDLVGSEVKRNDVVKKLVSIKQAAKEANIPVFYSPHHYTENEYKTWKHLNVVEKIMFERKMFTIGTWGVDFHPDLKPDDNTIVLSPHKGLSNFATGDINVQLRQRNIKTLIVAGMAANLCVESHIRDATEYAFNVITVKDAVAGPGEESTKAAQTNYEFLSERTVTAKEIVEVIQSSKNKSKILSVTN